MIVPLQDLTYGERLSALQLPSLLSYRWLTNYAIQNPQLNNSDFTDLHMHTFQQGVINLSCLSITQNYFVDHITFSTG